MKAILRWRPVVLSLVLFLSACYSTTAASLPEVQEAMESSDTVSVYERKKSGLFERTLYIAFEPKSTTKRQGVILYPGAFVDPKAYAPLARYFADEGYYAAIAVFPLDFALLGTKRASKVMRDFDKIDSWVMAGHSLGGTAMATYANNRDKQPRKLDGIVFLGSYPTPLIEDLSNYPHRVVSIYAENDGVTTLSDINNSRDQLPADTRYVSIPGGNHAQFGYYGPQDSDLVATISREKQQAIVEWEIQNLLDEIASEQNL